MSDTSPARSARRMAVERATASRERKKRGAKLLILEISRERIDRLVDLGLIGEGMRGDSAALSVAVLALVDRCAQLSRDAPAKPVEHPVRAEEPVEQPQAAAPPPEHQEERQEPPAPSRPSEPFRHMPPYMQRKWLLAWFNSNRPWPDGWGPPPDHPDTWMTALDARASAGLPPLRPRWP